MNEWIVLLVTLSAFISAALLFYISHLIRSINLRQATLLKTKEEHIDLTNKILNEIKNSREDLIKVFYDAHRGGRE